MKLQHSVVLIAVSTSLVVAACADGPRLTTPDQTAFATTMSISVVNRRTHRLEPLRAPVNALGISASVIAGSGTTDAVLVPLNSPGVATKAGHLSYAFVDSANHQNKAIVLYRPGGGPPAALQHWVDGKLKSTTAFSWTRTTSGWYMSQSLTRILATNGTLSGSYALSATITQITVPCSKTVTTNCVPQQTVRLDHPPISPAHRALGYAALGLAYATFPTDASAQFGLHFIDCAAEWAVWAFSFTGMYGLMVVMAAIPELSPAESAQLFSSMGLATAALKILVDCIVRHEAAVSGGFGGTGAGAGGTAETNADCDSGGYGGACLMAYVE